MPSDQDGFFTGQQRHDVALTALGAVVAGLAILVFLVLFAPPEFAAWIEPLVRPFGASLYGIPVWQIASVAILAVGSWLLVVDIRSE